MILTLALCGVSPESEAGPSEFSPWVGVCMFFKDSVLGAAGVESLMASLLLNSVVSPAAAGSSCDSSRCCIGVNSSVFSGSSSGLTLLRLPAALGMNSGIALVVLGYLSSRIKIETRLPEGDLPWVDFLGP